MAGGIMIALGRPKKPGKGDMDDKMGMGEEEESSDESSEEEIEAASDLSDAIDSKDPEAIVLAFKALCKATGY